MIPKANIAAWRKTAPWSSDWQVEQYMDRIRDVIGDDSTIQVVELQVKYPQGAEKMLIESIFRREVPSGKLPLDLEMVVNNVGTAAALTDNHDLLAGSIVNRGGAVHEVVVIVVIQ